jgi:hypothetical protein
LPIHGLSIGDCRLTLATGDWIGDWRLAIGLAIGDWIGDWRLAIGLAIGDSMPIDD